MPIRKLQQHASELIEKVQAGERVEVTRNGRLVAVLAPPDPEDQVIDELVAAGLVDPDVAGRVGSLAGWEPLPPQPDTRPLSEALVEMREEDRR